MGTLLKAKHMHDGDMPYQVLARKALPILVRQAQNKQIITYGDLALELGMPNPRNLNYVLGSIGTSIDHLKKEWKEAIPYIQSLVVKKNIELPGYGIGEFLGIKNAEFARLPFLQRRIIQDRALDEISMYQHWGKVLKSLKLKPAQPDFSGLAEKAAKVKTFGGFGGGESKEHKDLRIYVANHPEILKLGSDFSKGNMERRLASGDLPDVSFIRDANNAKNAFKWVAVEVKSAISSVDDISRGIFQCIKYKAVMEAEAKAEGKPPNIRVVLLLEEAFPQPLIPLKNILGVEVISNISPCSRV